VCVFALAGAAQADSAIAIVGTANAGDAFVVENAGNQLYYNPQPDTDYVWMNNNGDDPDVVATYNGYDRDGMKTFACADVAYGQAVNTIKMQFDYNTAADPTTGYNMGSVAMNFFLTDGSGHYGIWSATSGAALYTDTPIGTTGWTHRTLDCTSLSDTDSVAVYEHNGLDPSKVEPYTTMQWGDIKDLTIAGFYDYQRTPQGGFEVWNDTLWTDITNVGDPGDTTLNEYGITLNWGDTVGGTSVDGCGEIGDDADRPYGQAGRQIRDYQITVGEGPTVYDMTFEAGVAGAGPTTIPEPISMIFFGTGVVGVFGFVARRKMRKS